MLERGGWVKPHGASMTSDLKMADPILDPAVEVALVRPEIPPNVGNAARTCAAFGVPLHLVGEVGFSLTDPRVKRAGVDTWAQLELHCHDRLRDLVALTGARLVALTTGGDRSLDEFVFKHGDLLAFGREATGLEPADLQGCTPHCVRIPQARYVRSLNLATSVGIVVFTALRSLGALPV